MYISKNFKRNQLENIILGLLIFIAMALVSLISSCKSKPGTLTGNVFWKYNNYVGDKPDAGAEVFLFPSDTTKPVLQTSCDVQGNYKIENVAAGKYILIVKSKNANSSGEDNYNKLLTLNTSTYLGFNIHDIDPSLCDSIRIYRDIKDSVMLGHITSKNATVAGLSIYKFTNAIERLLSEIPYNSRYLSTYIQYPKLSKTDMREIEIKPNQNTSIVTDFGETYD